MHLIEVTPVFEKEIINLFKCLSGSLSRENGQERALVNVDTKNLAVESSGHHEPLV